MPFSPPQTIREPQTRPHRRAHRVGAGSSGSVGARIFVASCSFMNCTRTMNHSVHGKQGNQKLPPKRRRRDIVWSVSNTGTAISAPPEPFRGADGVARPSGRVLPHRADARFSTAMCRYTPYQPPFYHGWGNPHSRCCRYFRYFRKKWVFLQKCSAIR